MNRSLALRTSFLVAGLGAFAAAGDTDQILSVARAVWPGPQTVGVVCHFQHSEATLQSILDCVPTGSKVVVADVRRPENVQVACNAIFATQPHYVLMLPKDLVVRDGSMAGVMVIRAMNSFNVPTLATTTMALSQGAWAVAGPQTGNVLKVNPALKGYIEAWGEPIDPRVSRYFPDSPRGRATLTVVGTF